MRALVLLALAACGSSTPPATAPSPAPSDVPAAASSSAAPVDSAADATPPAPAASSAPLPAGPPPTGGSVLVGDINAPKGFDPKPVLVKLSSKLVDCYDQARAGNPSLHGKLTLHVTVNEAGVVNGVDADTTGRAYDPVLVQCIDTMLKASAHFPKPGGMATVNAPLVFRP